MYPSLSDGKLADLQDFLLLHPFPPQPTIIAWLMKEYEVLGLLSYP